MGDDAAVDDQPAPVPAAGAVRMDRRQRHDPHVLVDATQPGVRIPAHAVKDNRIVLNIAERAVARLEMGNDALGFTARFGGSASPVLVPLPAVIAIYARRNQPRHVALPGPDPGHLARTDNSTRRPEPPRRGPRMKVPATTHRNRPSAAGTCIVK